MGSPSIAVNYATVEASKSVPTLRCSRSGGCREAEPAQEEQSSPNCAPSSSLPHQPLRPPVELEVPKPQPLSCADDLSPEDYLHRKRLSCRSVPETMESGSSSLVQAAGAETVSGACNRSTSLILRVRPDDSWIHKAPPPSEDEPPRATVPVLHPIADLPLRMQEDNPSSHELSRPVRRVVSSMEPVFLRRRSPASVVRQPQSVPLLADS
nr:unnamed protein product [Spirometra erinaceieuropaei]